MHSPAGLMLRMALTVLFNLCAIGFMLAYAMGHKGATTGIILCLVLGWCIKPDLSEFEGMLDRLREHRRQTGRT